MKICKKCGAGKPEDRFRFIERRVNPYRRGTCMDCENDSARARRAADPDFRARENDATTRYKYGVSTDAVLSSIQAQGGCMICGITDAVWCIDHDHECCGPCRACESCIRGFVCRDCNTGLAMFQDSPEILEEAAKYLRTYQTRRQSPI